MFVFVFKKKKRIFFFQKKHGLKKTFLQILLQAGILIVLRYFLASDSDSISNSS